jgi:hypothetical protein
MGGGPLAFLVGTWAGEGEGSYPTISPFAYREEVTFQQPPGKPFLAYAQRTWALDDGRPLHAESGYWRWVGDGSRLEVVLAHPTGVAEVAAGTVDGTRVRVASTAVLGTPTAKPVAALERDLDVDVEAGVLAYVVRMAAVGLPLQHHLAARLARQPG